MVILSGEAIEGKVAKPNLSPPSLRHNNLFDRLRIVNFDPMMARFFAGMLFSSPKASLSSRRGRFRDRTRIDFVNRTELRQLAEDRVLDAQALLDAPGGGRWSAAYYLAGYAVECGLKACVLAQVERTGEIFIDKKFSEKCFTHNLTALIDLGGLKNQHQGLLQSNLVFSRFWGVTVEWTEASRYRQKAEADARKLFEAITNMPDGVLPWIQQHW